MEIEQNYKEVHKRKIEASVMTLKEEEFPWYHDILKILELRAYLDDVDKRERHSIRMMAIQYILCGGQLYRRSYDGIHLRCLKKEDFIAWWITWWEVSCRLNSCVRRPVLVCMMLLPRKS